MKKCLFCLFLFFISGYGLLPVFSQQKEISSRRFVGYIRNSKNQFAAGAKVCGWAEIGRSRGTQPFCVKSQTDGSFALDVRKWGGNTFSIFAEYTIDEHKLEDLMTEISDLQITNHDTSSNLAVAEIRLNLKTRIFGTNEDLDTQPRKYAIVEICRVDKQESCESTDVNFSRGKYVFLTPDSAYTVKIQLINGDESIEWVSVDKNNRQIKLLKAEFGAKNKLILLKAAGKQQLEMLIRDWYSQK